MENILVSQKGKIQIITINREAKLNALNKATLEEISEAIKAFEKNDAMRVAIVTGAGVKAFVAGADISEFAHFGNEEGEKLSLIGQEKVFHLIENCSKPIIAAVNGFALGGGLELAMACHIRVASENAKLGLPEVGLGVIPGYGGTQRLAQLVGKGKAMEMMVTCDMITAAEALEHRLVTHVTSLEGLMEKCEEIAGKIISKSGHAISAAIAAFNERYNNPSNGYKKEASEFGKCFGTEEFVEGTTAFLEKRKANFK